MTLYSFLGRLLCSFDLVFAAMVQVGVVYNPILKELYTAMRGHGAFLNNQPIHVSDKKQLEQAMLGTELGISRDAETMVRHDSARAMLSGGTGMSAAGWKQLVFVITKSIAWETLPACRTCTCREGTAQRAQATAASSLLSS